MTNQTVAVTGPSRGEIDGDQPQYGADTGAVRRATRYVGKEVHVIETGGAAAQHLRYRQLAAILNELLTDPATFSGPDMFVEPGHQGQVIRQSPQQGHGGVGMTVDQAGDQNVLGQPFLDFCLIDV